MKNCLFIGSFNPITKAHKEIALDLLDNKIVDVIYFLPVNNLIKTNLVNLEHRIEMIKLVINDENIKVLNINDYHDNLSFDTNVLFKIDKNITYLVMGDDILLNLKIFLNYEFILKNYHLIIINRFHNIDDLINKEYYNYKDKFIVINKTYQGSSTEARNDKSFKYLDKSVIEYIKKNNLYN